MKTLKYVGLILAGMFLVYSIAMGAWHMKRWFNYKFGYQSQVQAEIAPLENRVAKLEARVKELEARKQ